MRFVSMASLNTNPSQLEWLKSIDILDLVIKVFCIVLVLFFVYEFGEKIINKFGLTTARQRETKKYNEMLENTNTEIREFLDATSIVLQSIITEIANLKTKQEETERKNRESKKVQYKDRLYQSYRYYRDRAKTSGKKEWTKIEADGFWSMFEDYESYGGNGYVHEAVEPYMREFIIVDKEEY